MTSDPDPDHVGEAIRRALAYLTGSLTAAEAYHKIARLLRCVGESGRVASGQSITDAVELYASLADDAMTGKPADRVPAEAVDRVTLEAMAKLSQQNLCSDEDEVREAARTAIERRWLKKQVQAVLNKLNKSGGPELGGISVS